MSVWDSFEENKDRFGETEAFRRAYSLDAHYKGKPVKVSDSHRQYFEEGWKFSVEVARTSDSTSWWGNRGGDEKEWILFTREFIYEGGRVREVEVPLREYEAERKRYLGIAAEISEHLEKEERKRWEKEITEGRKKIEEREKPPLIPVVNLLPAQVRGELKGNIELESGTRLAIKCEIAGTIRES